MSGRPVVTVSGELLWRIAESMPVAVWVGKVPGGDLVYANPQFERIMGTPALDSAHAGAFSKPYKLFNLDGTPYPEDDLPFVTVVRTGQPTTLDDVVIHHDDGEHTHVRAWASPVRDDDGEMTHVVVAFSDITSEHRARTRLAESEARYRRLIEESPDFITSIDDQRTIAFINRDPPPASGVTRHDVVGRRVDDFIEPEIREHATTVIERVLATGVADSYESGTSTPDRHKYRVKVVPLPPATGGAEVLLVSTDITSEWRSAQQREAMLAELDHRVKNSLAMVMALADQSLRSSPTLEVFRETFMGRLRSLARAHEALAASRWRGITVLGIVAQCVQSLGEKNVRVDVRAGDQELPPQTATPLALALHELTTNAIKHGALSRPEGRLKLTVELPEPGSLVLHWEESGAGPQRAAPASTGLQLVHGLVEHEIGGTLHTTLGPDGRVYRLTLPFEPIEATP